MRLQDSRSTIADSAVPCGRLHALLATLVLEANVSQRAREMEKVLDGCKAWREIPRGKECD